MLEITLVSSIIEYNIPYLKFKRIIKDINTIHENL
jgi:hypothetical protein